MPYFIVVVDDAVQEQRKEITLYLGKKGGYWHWIPNFWLVNTFAEEQPTVIRDAIHKIGPGITCLVLSVELSDRTTWAGTFQTKWVQWLNKYWKAGV